jgi:hypothetical protein
MVSDVFCTYKDGVDPPRQNNTFTLPSSALIPAFPASLRPPYLTIIRHFFTFTSMRGAGQAP